MTPELSGDFSYLERLSFDARYEALAMYASGWPESCIKNTLTEDAREAAKTHGQLGEILCVDSPHAMRPSSTVLSSCQEVGRFCDVVFWKYPILEFDHTPRHVWQEGLLIVLHTNPDLEYQPQNLEAHMERDDLRLIPVESLTHIQTLQQAIHSDLMHEREVFLQYIDAFTESSEGVQTVAGLMDNRLRELVEKCKITGKPAVVTAEDAILQPSDTAPLHQCHRILMEGELTGFRCCDFGSENGADIYYELKPDPDTILLAGSDIITATETTRYYVPVSTDYELYSGYSKNPETEKS